MRAWEGSEDRAVTGGRVCVFYYYYYYYYYFLFGGIKLGCSDSMSYCPSKDKFAVVDEFLLLLLLLLLLLSFFFFLHCFYHNSLDRRRNRIEDGVCIYWTHITASTII